MRAYLLHYLLIPVLALYSFFIPARTSYTRMIDRVSSSIVRITGDKLWEGETRVNYICSGEVIAIHRVLTAAHCVGEHMRADGIPATVVAQDPYYDLALLVADTDKPPLILRDYPVQRFEQLTGIGYAWGFNRLTALTGQAFLLNISPGDKIAPGTLVQAQYIGGMSGGPVVDYNGHMVGIVQQSNTGIGFGVSTQLIRAFLLGTE